MDNFKAHKTMEVQRVMTKARIGAITTPGYSPELNFAEKAIRNFKARLYKEQLERRYTRPDQRLTLKDMFRTMASINRPDSFEGMWAEFLREVDNIAEHHEKQAGMH